jgi:hypothetical protein
MMQNQSTIIPNSTVLNEDTSTKLKELKYKIYCDMDGVLVNFNKRFNKLTSSNPTQYREENGIDKFWEVIDNEGVGFWVGIEWMDDGKELFNFLKENFDVELLSSPSRAENSRLGKRLWVRNHKLGVKLNLEYSRSKHKYAAPNHVLIDDRKDIIKDWENKGGIGILHTSAENTIVKLLNIIANGRKEGANS